MPLMRNLFGQGKRPFCVSSELAWLREARTGGEIEPNPTPRPADLIDSASLSSHRRGTERDDTPNGIEDCGQRREREAATLRSEDSLRSGPEGGRATDDTGGITLLELVIVIVVLGILIAILVPQAVTWINEGRETRARVLLSELEKQADLYRRDHQEYPPMDPIHFLTGPMVQALSRPGPSRQPYLVIPSPFIGKEDVADWPISEKSHIRNPVDPTQFVYYRNNQARHAPRSGPVPPQNKFKFDLWCSDSDGNLTGINNWGRGN